MSSFGIVILNLSTQELMGRDSVIQLRVLEMVVGAAVLLELHLGAMVDISLLIYPSFFISLLRWR